MAKEDDDFENLMVLREGRRKDVYLDTRKRPTVGIGHLVVPGDHLAVGNVISDDQVSAFFRKDSAAAMQAARLQAAQAGIKDTAFLPYLASVNFQLGPDWTNDFTKTWRFILDGRYEDAAREAADSDWARQTPVRLKDFQDALRRLPPKP
jgi:GH24 family phage-related lysozyme (muramidase)